MLKLLALACTCAGGGLVTGFAPGPPLRRWDPSAPRRAVLRAAAGPAPDVPPQPSNGDVPTAFSPSVGTVIPAKVTNVGEPQQKELKDVSIDSVLMELAAIQKSGPGKVCILGTRHCSYLHQQASAPSGAAAAP